MRNWCDAVGALRVGYFMMVVAMGALLAGTIRANVVLSDDFSDNSLDETKWTSDTSLADIYGNPSVVEQNQRLNDARGYLNSVNDYDPVAGAFSGRDILTKAKKRRI